MNAVKRSVLAGCVVWAWLAVAPGSAAASTQTAWSEAPAPRPLSSTSWLLSGLLEGQPFRLATEPWAAALERFFEPYKNHTPDWRVFLRGAYGPGRRAWFSELQWSTTLCTVSGSPSGGPLDDTPRLSAEGHDQRHAPALAELELHGPTWLDAPSAALDWPGALFAGWFEAPQPLSLPVAKPRVCKSAPRAVTVRSLGSSARVLLTDCHGALEAEALERLSELAAAPGSSAPRLLHPRLAWLVGEIARAFPERPLVILSGHREGGHSGFHGSGRALDLHVAGIPNEELYRVCRAQRDAGCGYYPHGKFVHVDVRPYATGRVTWIDESEPGTPSRYVDGWPGVLAPGIAWLGGD